MRKRGVSLIALTLVFAILAQISVSAEYVRIEKYTNGEKISEYTGEASEYSDFDASLFDFERYGAGVLFDFDSDDVYYAYPAGEQTVNMQAQTLATQPSESQPPVTTAFYTSKGYVEPMIGDPLYFEAKADFAIVPILAAYDGDNAMTGVSTDGHILSRGSSAIKAMVWDEDYSYPYTNPTVITNEKADFYGNSPDAATFISDIQKPVNGRIDYSGDIDYIKFLPPASGAYTIRCISCGGASAVLYNNAGTVLKQDFTSVRYTLNSGASYYIKVSGEGDYFLSIRPYNPEADSFNIYNFDMETNAMRKELDNICEILYDDDREYSKKIYDEYQQIFSDDSKLHELPDFLENSPKGLADFDELINMYFSVKYDELAEIKSRYKSLIEEYDENNGYSVEGDYGSPNGGVPVTLPDTGAGETEEEYTDEAAEDVQTRATASIDITSLTPTAINFKPYFPCDGAEGNQIYLIDFNGGATTIKNQYSYTVRNRGNTIKNLTPGGEYILIMKWTQNSPSIVGDYSLCKRIKLPYIAEEQKIQHDGKHVNAKLEAADKNKAAESDFNKWLGRMDTVYEKLNELTGYIPYDGRSITIESSREDLSEIKGMPDNESYWEIVYAWSGNPAVFGQAHYSALMKRLSSSDWGDAPIHELSHDFDDYRWEFDAEALALFKMYYVLEQTCGKVYRSDVATYYDPKTDRYEDPWFEGTEYYSFLKYFFYKGYNEYFAKGYYSGGSLAVNLIEIQKKTGWEPFKKTFRYFQMLSDEQTNLSSGEKLKLFLTKLKDYSGKDVLSYISDRDKGIIENYFGITLEYVAAEYPKLSGASNYTAEINLYGEGEAVYTFTAPKSGNYYIYTSAFGGTGASNDTCIDVYGSEEITAAPIVSNDDSRGGRFSQVSIAAAGGVTYYIKVGSYNGGQLHANLHASESIPVTELADGEYADTIVSYGGYNLYSFTPAESGVYTLYAESYGGGNEEYDTYLKLYGDKNMSRLIGNHADEIILRLDKGNTYYLQFSGYLMKYAKARVGVRSAGTLEFKKRTDSGFIYINHPEYITNRDIVDDEFFIPNDKKKKIFEQKGVSGKNTYYQTQTTWWDAYANLPGYFPSKNFYMDVDFYNPTNKSVTVDIENLAYGTEYRVLQGYYNGGINTTITIPAHEHRLLFETLGAPLYVTDKGAELTAWERMRIIVTLFDFTVKNGNVTVSSIAAYNRSNLYLRDGTDNIVDLTGYELNNGNVIYITSERPNERDIYSKYKGYAENESAWIDADLEFLIDDSLKSGDLLPIKLKDSYYTYGIANPKYSWVTSLSPLHDEYYGVLNALPNSLHNFKYDYDDEVRQWNFDFLHHNLSDLNLGGGADESVNGRVDEKIINDAKLDMAAGKKNHFPDIYNPDTDKDEPQAPDRNALSMGEWGTTYHYTVTVKNTCNRTRTIKYSTSTSDNIIIGIKRNNEDTYQTKFYAKSGKETETEESAVSVELPANTTTTFEIVTLIGGGIGGTGNMLTIDERRD